MCRVCGYECCHWNISRGCGCDDCVENNCWVESIEEEEDSPEEYE